MRWEIEAEPDVGEWLEGLSDADFIQSTAIIDRLSEQGNKMRMPFSRSLGDGLFELRYSCGGVKPAHHVLVWAEASDRAADDVPKAAK